MMSGGEPKRTKGILKHNVFSIKCLVLQNVLRLMLGDMIKYWYLDVVPMLPLNKSKVCGAIYVQGINFEN